MEYCNGGDLKELFEAKNYNIPFSIVHKMIRQIITGYKAIIGELIVHRDLKLKNILVHFNNQTT